jgi:MFS family permease
MKQDVIDPAVAGEPAIPNPNAPIPRQIRYIIGNEGCERFSFYGMRNILTVFLATSLLAYLPEAERGGAAKEVFHTFVIGVYFFPLLGGWIADRFFGKYNTIFWLSLVYCAGQACLAMFVTNRMGFYVGLSLVALGSGGIKPCVASFVGDQFDQTNKHRAKIVFDAFYWIINFGSLFASFLMPIFLKSLGPAIAFGIPGVLMFVSTFILWIARKQYVMLPPTPPDPHSFLNVCRSALMSGTAGRVLAIIGLTAAIGSFRLCDCGLPGAGRGDRVWRLGRLDAIGRGPRRASGGSDRRRALRVASARALRAGYAVLVALRSKGIDLGAPGGWDGKAQLVSVIANAGAQPGAGDVAHPFQ